MSELHEITRLDPNHILTFESALKQLEQQFADYHPLEFAYAMEQRSQQVRKEAVQQYRSQQEK